MAAGQIGIFGRDPQMACARDVARSVLGFGDGEVAVPEIEIDGGVELGVIEFLDHIRSHDAQLRRAMRHEGRHVEGAHPDQAHILARGRKGQRAVRLVVEGVFRHHARARHHRQRLVEDTALGHGEGECLRHGAGR